LGIWVGADNNTAMGRGHTGGQASTPIWIKTMKAIYEKSPETGSFKKPKGIGHISLCPLSHLHASEDCPKDRRSHDFFPVGRYPQKCVPAQDHKTSTSTDQNDIFNDSGEENTNNAGVF
jgi:membrane carboxypeptidase/penicillin-binding protein